MAPRAGGAAATGPSGEARLLRRTRLRLAAWSAGSTHVVLVALGSLLYVLLAQQLRADSETQLRTRAEIMTRLGSVVPLRIPLPDRLPLGLRIVRDAAQPGFQIGGPATGTIAVVIGEGGLPEGLGGLDPDAVEAALRRGESTLRESVMAMFDDAPVRTYTTPFERRGSTFAVQVVMDRRGEVRTLQLTLLVLALGGLLALAVAAALGWVYAGRALVPIRASLRRQREFAADASHELRTPLAVIAGNVELLRQAGPVAPIDREALDDLGAEVGRMTVLVDQLLLLARSDSDALDLAREPVDLAEVSAAAVDALGLLAAVRGITLALDVTPVLVTGDEQRLRQLVTLLVDNALRHAPDAGACSVRVTRGGSHALLLVDDDGPGIAPEHRQRVFDRFWRASDAPPGGNGLGLSIAAWIVERHGGTIEAQSSPAGGARLLVSIPAR